MILTWVAYEKAQPCRLAVELGRETAWDCRTMWHEFPERRGSLKRVRLLQALCALERDDRVSICFIYDINCQWFFSSPDWSHINSSLSVGFNWNQRSHASSPVGNLVGVPPVSGVLQPFYQWRFLWIRWCHAWIVSRKCWVDPPVLIPSPCPGPNIFLVYTSCRYFARCSGCNLSKVENHVKRCNVSMNKREERHVYLI